MSIKNYEIIKELGSGSYSIVFEVMCRSTKKHFAMKKIQLEKLSKNQRKYAETEIQTLKEVDHPHIIKFERSFEENGSLYIITELAPGGDLQARINILKLTNGKFDLDTIWRYSYQIIKGLKELHSRNIIHRDIKATNIFIMNEYTVKIGDLGICKTIDDEITSTQIGTPAAMSPEIWNGEGYNSKADIWSLGCLIYQMATLSHPFTSSNYVSLYQKITNVQYKKNFSYYPLILSSFIQKLLQRDPSLRPSSEDLLKLKCFARFKKDEKVCQNLHKTSLETETSSLHKLDLAYVRKKVNSEVSPQRFFESRKRISSIKITDFHIDREKQSFCDGSPLAVKDLKKRKALKLKYNEYGIQHDSNSTKVRNCKSVDRESRKAFEKLLAMESALNYKKSNPDQQRNNDENFERFQSFAGKIRVRTNKCINLLSSTPKPVHKARSFSRLKSIH